MYTNDGVKKKTRKIAKVACNYCRKKHVRCTGGPQCETCISKGLVCTYSSINSTETTSKLTDKALKAALAEKELEAEYWREKFFQTKQKEQEQQQANSKEEEAGEVYDAEKLEITAWSLSAQLANVSDVSRWLQTYGSTLYQNYLVPLRHWNGTTVVESFSDYTAWASQPCSLELLGILALGALMSGYEKQARCLHTAAVRMCEDSRYHPATASGLILIGDYDALIGDLEAFKHKYSLGLGMVGKLKRDPYFNTCQSLSKHGYITSMTRRIELFSANFFLDRQAQLVVIRNVGAETDPYILQPQNTPMPLHFSLIALWCVLVKMWLSISTVSPQLFFQYTILPSYTIQAISQQDFVHYEYALYRAETFINHRLSGEHFSLYKTWGTTVMLVKSLVYYAGGLYDDSFMVAQECFKAMKDNEYMKSFGPIAMCMLFDLCQIAIYMRKGDFFTQMFSYLFKEYNEMSKPYLKSLLSLANNCGLQYEKGEIIDRFFEILPPEL